MAIRKKGSRPINVDEIEYRWRVRHRPTNMQEIFGWSLTVAVELAERAKSPLIVDLSKKHPTNWMGDPVNPVTPREIASAIRAALKAGWSPTQPGSTFRLKMECVDEPKEAGIAN